MCVREPPAYRFFTFIYCVCHSKFRSQISQSCVIDMGRTTGISSGLVSPQPGDPALKRRYQSEYSFAVLPGREQSRAPGGSWSPVPENRALRPAGCSVSRRSGRRAWARQRRQSCCQTAPRPHCQLCYSATQSVG